MLGEGAALAEHGVDQGGLAVVDVGDDGEVAQVVAGGGLGVAGVVVAVVRVGVVGGVVAVGGVRGRAHGVRVLLRVRCGCGAGESRRAGTGSICQIGGRREVRRLIAQAIDSFLLRYKSSVK